MKIKKVEIEAFRAYKKKSEGTFDFTNSDDLASDFIAIFAPNGFGKSSFYDAVEWAVTNHLERLAGDYNRSNYEGAARITKDATKGQEILRNRYVGKEVTTRVVVSTTRTVPFARELGNIRVNGRDLRFDDKGRENDYFRRVILSQDEIDRFLRESKPQERYTKFMESFGGDTEKSRKELTALIIDNKAECVALDDQRKAIILELDQPVDLSIFESFNAVASQLNATGESILLANKNFSAQAEHTLNASLVARQHELNVEQEANFRAIDTLAERLAKIPEIKIHNNFVTDQKFHLARLDQGSKDADAYQELLNAQEKSASHVRELSQRLAAIVDVTSHSGEFLQYESRLKEIDQSQKTLRDSRIGYAAQLSGLAKALEDSKQELKLADDRTALLKNIIDNSGVIYAELAAQRARIEFITQEIAKKEISARLDRTNLDDIDIGLRRLSGLKITAEFILSEVEGGEYLDKKNIDLLTRYFIELESIDAIDKVVHATQQSLNDQMGVHERLISSGLEYLSAWPSHICPLCSASHENSIQLRETVKAQTLLSRLVQENSDQLAFSETRRKQLLEKVQLITNMAVEAHVQKIADLRLQLKELNDRLIQIDREKSDLEVENRALEERVSTLDKAVWSLAQEELLTRAQGESSQLLLKRSDLVIRQSKLTEDFSQLNRNISANDVNLQVLTSEADAIRSQSVYLLVLNYIFKNGVNSDQLSAFCQSELGKFESQIANSKTENDELVKRCNALHQKMLSEGTWVNFSQIRSQKEALDLQIIRAQAVINAFYESLANFIAIRIDHELDQVSALITSEIQKYRLRTESIEKTENKFKLLLELMASFKPYVKRISLQAELAELEVKLDQRIKADILLNAERSTVIDKLKTLINNFFYEDLINVIYKKIDPHPSFKKVEFKPDFDSDKPGLNIVVSDKEGFLISPILYFSAAQSNILTLSVFLANALHAVDDKGKPIDVVMIDDPIQSMDSINILSTIDLLRSICLQFNKQVIISTHDENFFGLLQRKIPAEIFGAKFLRLEKFGVVVPVEPLLN
ncbi:MAG: hypothetical protein RR311_01010 [Comamonas sp.]